MRSEKMRKVLSFLMALVLVAQNLPAAAFAAEDCAHHPEHTADCGYAEAVAGVPCTHVHDAACGYVAAVEGHECHYACAGCANAFPSGEGGTAAAVTDEGEAIPVTTEATKPAPVCTCGTDDTTHATTCAVYVAPEDPVCYCAEKCTEPNQWCDICGFDYSKCGGADSAAAYTETTTIYFNNTASWTNVNVYYWGGTSSTHGPAKP